MSQGRLTRALCVSGALLASGCSSNDSKADAPSANGNNGVFGTGGTSFNPGSSGFGGASGAAPGGQPPAVLPPETEKPVSFELPHAGEHFVYVANTDSDTVAVIDAQKLTIQIAPAGDQPRFLQTLAGADSAIVLNVASNDATIIRTDSTGASKTSSVLVKPGSNAGV